MDISSITQYVDKSVETVCKKRTDYIKGLELQSILANENPYLLRCRYSLSTVGQIVCDLTNAFIASNEETIFGDWLEGLAIYINQQVYGGKKSGIPNIDLEFDDEDTRYIVSIKSGPNWGNSSQIKKMKSDFITAKRTLRTSNSKLNIVAVNGCCYGKDNRPDKGDYFKYCGQDFWQFISGEDTLFTDLIEPLGHKAKERNDEFMHSYAKMINLFTREFASEFCDNSGEIEWKKLVEFNSGKQM